MANLRYAVFYTTFFTSTRHSSAFIRIAFDVNLLYNYVLRVPQIVLHS